MKTKEQIDKAQELISELQDYVELAKTEKRLKNESHRISVETMIEDIVNDINEKMEDL